MINSQRVFDNFSCAVFSHVGILNMGMNLFKRIYFSGTLCANQLFILQPYAEGCVHSVMNNGPF